MDLYSSIERRKSCRKYNMAPLALDVLESIRDAVGGFEPLYPGVPFGQRFIAQAKGGFLVKAPHYLIVSGQGKAGEPEAAGFLFEQLSLWMAAKGIGSVWLGGAKDVEPNRDGVDLIALAFGTPAEAIHRERTDFSRKPVGEITNAPDDACIRAAHLAPSGMNLQPWYFEKTQDGVNVYRQKLKPPFSLIYKLTELDMGIALCHYALACRHIGRPFSFRREDALPAKKGYEPFGVIA